MTETVGREEFLADALWYAHQIVAGQMPRGSVTAMLENMARAVLLLDEERKPKPIKFAVETRAGMTP